MSKHTPGPWEVAYQDKNGQSVVKGKHIEVATCWHHCVGSIEKEMHSNARLIAAAPDLLEALQMLLKRVIVGYDGLPQGYGVSKARAAIAKATGDQHGAI